MCALLGITKPVFSVMVLGPSQPKPVLLAAVVRPSIVVKGATGMAIHVMDVAMLTLKSVHFAEITTNSERDTFVPLDSSNLPQDYCVLELGPRTLNSAKIAITLLLVHMFVLSDITRPANSAAVVQPRIPKLVQLVTMLLSLEHIFVL